MKSTFTGEGGILNIEAKMKSIKMLNAHIKVSSIKVLIYSIIIFVKACCLLFNVILKRYIPVFKFSQFTLFPSTCNSVSLPNISVAEIVFISIDEETINEPDVGFG